MLLRKVKEGINRCKLTPFGLWKSAPRIKAIGCPHFEAVCVRMMGEVHREILIYPAEGGGKVSVEVETLYFVM